jgi:hypothetical protein
MRRKIALDGPGIRGMSVKISKMTVLRLIGRGIIHARQVCKGAPWAIPKAELAGLDPRTALLRPQSENPDQRSFVFQ